LRWAAILVGVIASAVAVPSVRASALRSIGNALVAEDALAPSDVIVLTVDANGAGILEASDLVQRGISKRVAFFADPLDAADLEFQRRGLPNEDEASNVVRLFGALGVHDVEEIPVTVNGSEDEARILPDWADHNRVRSIVLVTSRDHSRRLTRAMRRAVQGRPIVVRVRSAQLSAFDPDRWWQSRRGLRIGLVELEKLALDVVRHPFS
jgi:hypothetical protein